MNKKLIEKVIKSSDVPCLELDKTFENPLLSKHVAKALSKSFINLLNLTNQTTNINIRFSIVDNIRRLCKVNYVGHIKVNEQLADSLTELYRKDTKVKVNKTQGTDEELDALLLRTVKEINVDSKFESVLNPEVIQSLLNLNEEGVYLDTLSKDILHWNINCNPAYLNIAKDLWKNNIRFSDNNITNLNILNDVSLKMKAEIEKMLLSNCYDILTNKITDVDDLLTNNSDLRTLIYNCSKSTSCFQLSCGVLNFLFMMTNFDSKIQEFVQLFVSNVKDNCLFVSFSVLYPIHLAHLVVLLDIDLDELSGYFKNHYLRSTVNYLGDVHKKSEHDFIMLLSHYPQWFNIYFDNSYDN